jgi:hypothetical protein
MEIVATENTTIIGTKELRNATAPDGTIFTERRMTLKILFTGVLFMKIEQKVEYTGKFNKIKPNLFRIRREQNLTQNSFL